MSSCSCVLRVRASQFFEFCEKCFPELGLDLGANTPRGGSSNSMNRLRQSWLDDMSQKVLGAGEEDSAKTSSAFAGGLNMGKAVVAKEDIKEFQRKRRSSIVRLTQAASAGGKEKGGSGGTSSGGSTSGDSDHLADRGSTVEARLFSLEKYAQASRHSLDEALSLLRKLTGSDAAGGGGVPQSHLPPLGPIVGGKADEGSPTPSAANGQAPDPRKSFRRKSISFLDEQVEHDSNSNTGARARTLSVADPHYEENPLYHLSA